MDYYGAILKIYPERDNNVSGLATLDQSRDRDTGDSHQLRSCRRHKLHGTVLHSEDSGVVFGQRAEELISYII